MLKPNLIAWVNFKSAIFEIIDHRIANAEEIDGSVNNTYMSLDEHLVIWMLEKHKTRSATEYAIIDFLYSLKYYAETW